ncbi:hypothetical protein [Actinoplanes sp. G11-F43]
MPASLPPDPEPHPVLDLLKTLIETAPDMIRESTPVVLAVIAVAVS